VSSLDLAALASASGNPKAAAARVAAAHRVFRELDVPLYVERAERLAREIEARSFSPARNVP